MAVSKSRMVRGVLILCLVYLASALFLAAQSKSPAVSSLESLLNGSSADVSGVLLSLNDSDLPTALAVAEALKFKALHGDIAFSAPQAEEFRQAVEMRISRSKIVSLQSAPEFPNAIPQHNVMIGGLELPVPAHFLAAQPLRITDFTPQGEAGTILPECRVSFVTDHQPVKALMLIDGNTVKINETTAQSVGYIPPAGAATVFALGTHTVSVQLSDAGNAQASASWAFTVGVRPVPIAPLPPDARCIGSFPIDISKFSSNSSGGFGLRAVVFVTPDGKRFIEYVLHPAGDPDHPVARTRDPFWIRRIIYGRDDDSHTLTISPKSPCAFPGNTLVFSVSHTGPGVVKKTVWTWRESATSHGTEEGETMSRTLNEPGLSVRCSVEIGIPLPDGGESSLTLETYDSKRALRSIFTPQNYAVFNGEGRGSVTFDVQRRLSIDTLGQYPLVEGRVYPLDGGTLTITKASVRAAAGNGVVISNPTAL